MLQNKFKFFFLFSGLFFGVQLSRAQMGYALHSWLVGPLFGTGITTGSRDDYKQDVFGSQAGASTQFGLSVYRVNEDFSFGASVIYMQSKWKFKTNPSVLYLQPETRYVVNEKNLTVPLEMNYYLNPGLTRGFIGLAVSPAWLAAKNLQRMRSNSGDTTTAAIFPETINYHRISMGFNLKAGVEGEVALHHSGRIFLELTPRFTGSKTKKASRSVGIFLTAQFFFVQ